MLPQEFAAHITEIILGAGSLFLLIAKHREAIQFCWKTLVFLSNPFRCVWRWIKLARKIETATLENKNDILSLKKDISELSDFIKYKLSPNGGSSIADSIKRIESRQISSDARALALINDAKSGHFYCDLNGRNTWINRTYARLLGCGAEELMGYGWRKFIATEELERYSKVWHAAFNDGCEFEDTVEFLNTSHNKIKLHISVIAVKDEKGQTISYIGQVTPL